MYPDPCQHEKRQNYEELILGHGVARFENVDGDNNVICRVHKWLEFR